MDQYPSGEGRTRLDEGAPVGRGTDSESDRRVRETSKIPVTSFYTIPVSNTRPVSLVDDVGHEASDPASETGVQRYDKESCLRSDRNRRQIRDEPDPEERTGVETKDGTEDVVGVEDGCRSVFLSVPENLLQGTTLEAREDHPSVDLSDPPLPSPTPKGPRYAPDVSGKVVLRHGRYPTQVLVSDLTPTQSRGVALNDTPTPDPEEGCPRGDTHSPGDLTVGYSNTGDRRW